MGGRSVRYEIYPLIRYCLSVLPLSSTEVVELERSVSFHLMRQNSYRALRDLLPLSVWGRPWNHEHRDPRHTLRLQFLGCSQVNENGSFWKNTPRKPSCLWGTCTWMRARPTLCPETSGPSSANADMLWEFFLGYRLASLWSDRCLESYYIGYGGGRFHNDLIEVRGWSFAWAPCLKCLNNDETSFTWLMIRNVLSIVRKSFVVDWPFCQNAAVMEK